MKNYFLIIYYYLFWAYCLIYINKYQKSNKILNGDWGLGIGDCGL